MKNVTRKIMGGIVTLLPIIYWAVSYAQHNCATIHCVVDVPRTIGAIIISTIGLVMIFKKDKSEE